MPQNQSYRNLNSREVIRNFLNLLRNKQCFRNLSLRELLAPNGWADKVAKSLQGRIKVTQLRKYFNEIKNACELAKQGNIDKARIRIWKLYPLIAYATARNIQGKPLMPLELAELLEEILKKVEQDQCNQLEDYERLEDFITALYAYFKRYNPKG
jgi:CRISPR type III-A-associated protein Csm2